MRSLGLVLWVSFLVFSIFESASSSSSADLFSIDGKVLELTDSNFDSAISQFDFIFVDFYAPWCGHCKRLSPELDAAAPILAKLKQPIVVAKLDADKYSRLARKLEIDAFPTLMLYNHGVPMEYYGPRKADLLVRFLKKFVAPDAAVLDSDSAVKDFVDEAGTYFPMFIGFGLNESVMSNIGAKYKKKAWFAVAKGFSEDIMVSYDFDKVPALVARHPQYNERSVFYGPFEDGFLEEFVKQNFLPLIVPLNHDTLKLLKDDERKILLAIVEDENHESSKKLIGVLRAAAYANRDLVFGYVGVEQFEEFADKFHANKKTKLPKVVVWGGDEEYHQVIGVETIDEEDQLNQVSRFLQGYREGRTEKKGIKGPSFMGFINSLIGIKTVYIIVFLVAVLMMIRSLGEAEEPPRVRTTVREQADQTTSSEAGSSEHKPRNKED